MADFLGLMKQAAELKSKMETMQAELEQIEVDGTSGGGLVTVRLSGKGEMKSVKIDELADQAAGEGDRRGPHRGGPRRCAPQGRDAGAGQDEGRHRRIAAAARPEAVLGKGGPDPRCPLPSPDLKSSG